jgi:hypothetical protein
MQITSSSPYKAPIRPLSVQKAPSSSTLTFGAGEEDSFSTNPIVKIAIRQFKSKGVQKALNKSAREITAGMMENEELMTQIHRELYVHGEQGVTKLIQSEAFQNNVIHFLKDKKIKNTAVSVAQDASRDLINQFYLNRKNYLQNLALGAGTMATGWYVLPAITTNTKASNTTAAVGAGVFGWNVKKFVNTVFNRPTSDRNTAQNLVNNARDGHLGKVKHIVGSFVDLEATGTFKPDVQGAEEVEVTPLQVATLKKQHDVMEFLLDAGAEVDSDESPTAVTPFFMAVANQDHKAIKMLIKRGANLNKGPDGSSPLLQSILQDDLTTFKLLVEAGAHKDRVDLETGLTPLQIAARQGKTRFANYLRQAGALDIDAQQARITQERARDQQGVSSSHSVQELQDSDSDDNPFNRTIRGLIQGIEIIDEIFGSDSESD